MVLMLAARGERRAGPVRISAEISALACAHSSVAQMSPPRGAVSALRTSSRLKVARDTPVDFERGILSAGNWT